MLKWLRKYSKALMIFFGVFLMISFLVPQAISQLGQGGNPSLFTVGGRSVRALEAQRVSAQIQAVENATLGVFPISLGIDARGTGVEHWVIAKELTLKSGFTGGTADGPELIPQAAQVATVGRLGPEMLDVVRNNPQIMQMLQQQADQQAAQVLAALPQIAQRNRLSERELNEGLAVAKGMLRMKEMYLTSPRLSENRLLRKARQDFDQAEMQVLFIGAEPDILKAVDPPEAALQEHFDKYKDKVAGVDDNAFGYMRPRRYKLEYMTIERKGVEDAVKISALDVQKKMLDGESKEITDATARRTAIETKLRTSAADKVYAEAKLAFTAEVLSATRGLATEGGMYTLPTDWKRPLMAEIAGRVAAKVRESTGINIPTPSITIREADWLTDEDVQRMPGFGGATVARGNSSVSVGQMLPFVRELRKAEDPKVELALQVGVPFASPVDDSLRNRHFFTVIEARAASPAESLAEVRAQVINDRRKADAYAALAARVAEFETIALATGLEALQEQLKAGGGVTTDLRAGVRVSGRAVSPADSGANTKAFMEAASAKMAALDPTIPLEKASPSDLIVAAKNPTKLGVAIGKFTTFTPVTIEKFRPAARGLALQAAQDLMVRGEDILSRERLDKLMKFEGMQSDAPPEVKKEEAKKEEGKK